MALANKLDPGTVADRMAAWLPTVMPAISEVTVSGVHVPTTGGHSSESVLFEATWSRRYARETVGLVARVAPSGDGLFREYDLGREASVMAALARGSSVAVPDVLAHEETGEVLGAPFLLVERRYGRVAGDDPPFTTGGWVTELSEAQRTRLFDSAVETLALIAQADVPSAVYTALLRSAPGDTLVEQEYHYWKDFYEWTCTDRRSPIIDAGFESLDARVPAQDGPVSIIWGDARFGNLMFGDDLQVSGVFDWEMASVGVAEVDLAFFLFANDVFTTGMGVPVPSGFRTREAVIPMYERMLGRELNDFRWFEIFAGVRATMLVMRTGMNLIEIGTLPSDSTMPLVNPGTFALADLLGLPRPAGDAGWVPQDR